MDGQEKQTKKRMTGKTKKTAALLSAVIAVVIAAARYTLFIKPTRNTPQWKYDVYTVQKGTLKNGVTESGTVELGITSQVYDLDVSTESDDDDGDDEQDFEQHGIGALRSDKCRQKIGDFRKYPLLLQHSLRFRRAFTISNDTP